ncbi:CopD family protein [Deinococcus apachensis]|uniref:CopD family protein n=1 Tax=Deinococcus apachensis TaxID=309886 RepID=UPI00037FE006|nr:CopD family protein [Deinococcus apachensis]
MLPALAAAGFLTALGTLLLVGGAFARRAFTPAHPRPGWLALGFALLVLGAALEVGWTLSDLGFLTFPDVLAYVTTTAPGRAALTAVMGGALLLAAELSGWPGWLSVLPAALFLWGVAGEGHGGSHGPGTRVLTVLHVGAMGVWLGGVLALLTVPGPTPALARRFTPVALTCVALLVGTGILLTVRHAGNLLALPESLYGRTLLVKLGVAALTLLAAVLVRRAFARGRAVRRHLALETLLLLGVLGVSAALGTTSPPTHGEHAHTTAPP